MNLEEMLPDAKAFAEKVALKEAEEASRKMRELEAADAEKQAWVDSMRKPSGVSDEEAIRRAIDIIQRAVSNGLTSVQVYRFPNALCTDRGRAINQGEPDWPQTLTGVPKEIFQLWDRHFKAKGYRLSAQIVDFPGGVPGDVGLTLAWG
ncbi:hypothetical protein [Prosthecomicrobium sp. N25]|uniref:hypothetical protein n=1 Tax=Prosthecomicrobium sp. N25 TaxID=3129254 RepID=UPI003076D42B